jgi:hypothetical protein
LLLSSSVCAFFLCARPDLARAESAPAAEQVEELKRQMAALKEQLAAMAARVEALEAAAAERPGAGAASAAPSPAPATAEVPPGAAGGGGPSGAVPLYGGLSAGSKVFNPDIAVIGDFLGAAGTNAPAGEPSLELHEAELSFQAVVDPYARADFFFTVGPDEVGVEEGYITFPTLPGGFLAKVGKTRDVFGKMNGFHNHVLPFTDRPLVTRNLTGGEEGMADYGLTLSRLIPNPWLFLEATGQVYRGRSEVFDGTKRADLAYVGHLRAYRDLGEASNLDLGASFAKGSNDAGPGLHTRLLGVDATYRWRPLRRAIYNRFLARTELVWSRREEPGAAKDAFGFYASAEYQFARRWFLGARFDQSDRATGPDLKDKGGSLLLTYWPSEFSQVRGQYRRTRLGEGSSANEFLFQFLFAIGAHGAHPF